MEPIVLVHGLCGLNRVFACRRPVAEYFPGVRATLEACGHRVLVPRLSPTGAITVRAAELKAIIRRELGTQSFHVVGHSLGGLDARYMTSRLGMESQVRSLTTIGTPHRGSTFADWSLDRFARNIRPLFRAAGVPDDAFFDLTVESCARFNESVPDVPGIRYASVAGICVKPWLGPEWALSSRIVGNAEGPNDGVVSVQSAAWGERCDVWHGDHLNLVNWPNRKARRRGVWRDRAADYAQLLAATAVA